MLNTVYFQNTPGIRPPSFNTRRPRAEGGKTPSGMETLRELLSALTTVDEILQQKKQTSEKIIMCHTTADQNIKGWGFYSGPCVCIIIWTHI